MNITTDDFPNHLNTVVRLLNTKSLVIIYARVKNRWENNEEVFYLSGFMTEMDVILTKLARNPNYTMSIDEDTKLVERILANVFSQNNRL